MSANDSNAPGAILWEATLHSTVGTSDKVYSLLIVRRGGTYDLVYLYGRRGSKLKSGYKCSGSLGPCMTMLDKIARQQLSEGYVFVVGDYAPSLQMPYSVNGREIPGSRAIAPSDWIRASLPDNLAAPRNATLQDAVRAASGAPSPVPAPASRLKRGTDAEVERLRAELARLTGQPVADVASGPALPPANKRRIVFDEHE